MQKQTEIENILFKILIGNLIFCLKDTPELIKYSKLDPWRIDTKKSKYICTYIDAGIVNAQY